MTGSRSIDRLEGKSKGFRHITPCGTVPFSRKIINGENSFGTIWTELDLDYSEFAVRDQEADIKMPTATKSAGFNVERMSDATNQYMLCEPNETSSRGPIRIHQIRGMYSMSEVQREPLRQSCLGAGPMGPTRTAQGRGE